jgi:hypothetical protein
LSPLSKINMIVVTTSLGLVLYMGTLFSLNIRSMEKRGRGGLIVSSYLICSSVKKVFSTVLESIILTFNGK